MNRLYPTLVWILAITVIILSGMMIHNRPGGPASEPGDQAGQVRRIERMSEFEAAMEKLGYKARGYRWHGGMIDGIIRVGSGDPSLKPLDGQVMLTDLRNFSDALNETSVALSSVTGTLLVVVGPIPENDQSTDVPCRFYIQAESPSGQAVSRDFRNLVQFALFDSDQEMTARVFGKWEDPAPVTNVRVTDAESAYNLIELQWLSEDDPVQVPTK